MVLFIILGVLKFEYTCNERYSKNINSNSLNIKKQNHLLMIITSCSLSNWYTIFENDHLICKNLQYFSIIFILFALNLIINVSVSYVHLFLRSRNTCLINDIKLNYYIVAKYDETEMGSITAY